MTNLYSVLRTALAYIFFTQYSVLGTQNDINSLILHFTNMEILKRVIHKSIFIILPCAVISGFYEWKKLPLGIIAGGLFGILNLRGLVRSVEGFINSNMLSAKLILMSFTRLFILFSAIFILLWFKIINVFGLLFGFTVVFILILVEGMKIAKSN